MDTKLHKAVQRMLGSVDEQGVRGVRLMDDAGRLWRRCQRLLDMNLVGPIDPTDALELACHALQLPFKSNKTSPIGRLGRTNLKDRAEQAAELLVGFLGDEVDESLLDRTTRLLQMLPQRAIATDEAKILGDAVNLEDFGVVGFISQAIVLGKQGDGVLQVADGCLKREQYGYWEARLKDSFHFEPVRQIARNRLEATRQVCTLLAAELQEDRAT